MNNGWKYLAGVCTLVVGVYAYMAQPGPWESLSQDAADSTYNLLVQGFRDGQLSLKKEVPTGFAQLANPYDPGGNARYQFGPDRLHDLSYYKGRLFLYFGVTPALVLFWPYLALTGEYLFHSQAVTIFCAIGFLASMWLLYALWRRHFAEVSAGVVVACALALGLATGAPVMLSRSDFYEVPISCGYMMTMLALAAIWCALHEPERKCRWLAAASVAYGLAVGARPSLLFGAVILLVPVAQTWRERRPESLPRSTRLSGLLAAVGPITFIGLGLMLYNFLRFDNPFEFGWHYQLAGVQQVSKQDFSLRYLWFNFRMYFLEPARWSARSPFVDWITVRSLPAGYTELTDTFGVLTNVPLVWLALAAPLAWRTQSGQIGSILRWFVTAVALLFGICALTLGLFCSANFRYEVDFLPAFLLLAVLGILGLERGLADRPAWRRAARWGWGVLLGFSVAFNLLASVGHYAEAHNNMGSALEQTSRLEEAIKQYEQALRIKPDLADAHYNLGVALGRAGQMQEAIEHLEQALRLEPAYADAHCNLGVALEQTGRLEEAIKQYEQALRIRPDYAEAHNKLGIALEQARRVPEALEHYEQAVRIKPDFAEAHDNLGNALRRAGKVPEAIEQYEQVLRIKPDYAEVHNTLGTALEQVGRVPEAMEHYKQALQIKPDLAEAHYNLGAALEQTGQVREAITHYELALRIKPDFTEAQNALARLHKP